MTYKELRLALKVFDLGERATLNEIKSRHRELVKKYHPDAGSDDSAELRKVNAAYRVLLDYVGSYRFSFAEEEFYEQNPEERMLRQFMDEAFWEREDD